MVGREAGGGGRRRSGRGIGMRGDWGEKEEGKLNGNGQFGITGK